MHARAFSRLRLFVRRYGVVSCRGVCMSVSGLKNNHRIISLLHGYGKRSFDISSSKLNSAVDAVAATDSISEFDIGKLFVALDRMCAENVKCDKYISALSRLLSNYNGELSARTASTMLYNIRHLTSYNPQSRAMLASIVNVLQRQDNLVLDGRRFSSALFGCQLLSAKHSEVRQLLKCLADISMGCVLDYRGVAMSLYGIRDMSSDYAEVRRILRILSQAIPSSSDPTLPPQVVASALYGLQSLSCRHKEVRTLLRRLGLMVTTCTGPYTVHEITQSLYGLHRMRHPAALLVVSHLTAQIPHFVGSLTSSGMAIGMYGLRSLESKHAEVRSLMKALSQRLRGQFEVLGENMTFKEVSMAMCALTNKDSRFPEVRAMVHDMANLLDTYMNTKDSRGEEVDLRGLSMICRSLSYLRPNDDGVHAILQSVCRMVDDAARRGLRLDREGLECVCESLRRMHSHHSTVRKLLLTYTPLVARQQGILDGQCVAVCLRSMCGLSSDHDEVRVFVSHLAEMLSAAMSSRCTLDPIQLSEALYGMQGLSTSHAEVRSLLECISVAVTRSEGKIGGMSASEVSRSLYGMHNMCASHWTATPLSSCDDSGAENSIDQGIDFNPVGTIVTHLAQELSVCSTPLSAHQLAMCVYGLRSTTCQHPHSRQLLNIVAAHASRCSTSSFSSADVANALYGLQGVSSDVPASVTLLRVLRRALHKSRDSLQREEIVRCVRGLATMKTDNTEVIAVLDILTTRVNEMTEAFSFEQLEVMFLGLKDHDCSAPGVVRFLNSLQKNVNTSEHQFRSSKNSSDSIKSEDVT